MTYVKQWLAVILMMFLALPAYAQMSDTTLNDTWGSDDKNVSSEMKSGMNESEMKKNDKGVWKMDDLMKDYSYDDRQQLRTKIEDKITEMNKKIDKSQTSMGDLKDARDNLKKQTDKIDKATRDNWDQTLKDIHSSVKDIKTTDKKDWKI